MPAASRRGGAEIGAELEFGRLLRGIRQFDKTLATATRKRLRDAAKPAITDVRGALLAGGPSRTGLRAGLAAGTKLTIRGGRNAGVAIVTTSEKLPPGKRAMVRAWNKQSFRHRVFGGDTWVTQPGRPYFDRVLDRHRPALEQAAAAALEDAVNEIERGMR